MKSGCILRYTYLLATYSELRLEHRRGYLQDHHRVLINLPRWAQQCKYNCTNTFIFIVLVCFKQNSDWWYLSHDKTPL